MTPSPGPTDSAQVRSQLVTSLELELIGPTQRVLKALAADGQGLESEALDRLPSSWYITGCLVPTTTDLSLRCDDTADDDLAGGWMGSISAGPAARTRPTSLGAPGMMAAPAMAVRPSRSSCRPRSASASSSLPVVSWS
jgi:hypothetical protein